MSFSEWQEGPPLEAIIGLFEGLKKKIDDDIKREYEKTLGLPFDLLLRNHRIVMPLLADPDEERRCLALSFVTSHWPEGEAGEAARILVAAARKDLSAKVRGLAATLLSEFAVGIQGTAIRRVLADVLKDENETVDVKANAYLSLVGPKHPDFMRFLTKEKRLQFSFPADVDWPHIMGIMGMR